MCMRIVLWAMESEFGMIMKKMVKLVIAGEETRVRWVRPNRDGGLCFVLCSAFLHHTHHTC